MNQEEIENHRKAGEIARKIKEYCRKTIKKDTLLVDIADRIEDKIVELGGKPAFPVNLSINEIAAHHTPRHESKDKTKGLLKIDIGVHIQGYIVDTAITLDLENNEENKKLIESTDRAVEEAIKLLTDNPKIEIWKIGNKIQETISSFGFSPIKNLSGHSLDKYKVHAGITIPNYNNNNKNLLVPGVYAIEPFSTTGSGIVYEGKESGVYELVNKKPVRDFLSREILKFIEEEYKTLPFSERIIIRKFGKRALLSLNSMEKSGILKSFPELIDKSRGKVSQSEHTILITEDKIEVLT